MEFVGVLPLLAIGALACVQATLLAGSLIFAQVAVDRAAHGATDTRLRRATPRGWTIRVARRQSQVTVRVTTPVVLPGVGDRLVVRAEAVELIS